MSGKSRAIYLVGLLAALLGALIMSGSDVNASGMVLPLGRGMSQTPSDILIELWVSPVYSTAGDVVTLSLKLTSNRTAPVTPDISLSLPQNLSFDSQNMPAGTIFNIQNNSVNWQPLLAGPGSTASLSLPLSVKLVDVHRPEQILTARVNDGFSEYDISTSFWVGVLPQATISFDPPQVAVGQPVRMLGAIAGPGPITEQWLLGDGRTVDATNPEVVFSTNGIYDVTLLVSNPLGTTKASGRLIVIPQPIARFAVDTNAAGVDEPLHFLNRSGGQPPLSYRWDFGDGGFSTEANPRHIYTSAGTYQVRLLVENETGQSESILPVTIGQLPVADLVVEEFGDAGKLITGQAFTDDTVSLIVWDSGDGSVYEGAQFNHVYWTSGDYLVTMTVSNTFGSTQVSRWIRIRPGMLYLHLPYIRKSIDLVAEATASDTNAIAPETTVNETTELAGFELPLGMQNAEQLLAYINEARRLNNLRPVEYVYELSVAAQQHTDDMASNGYTGHVGVDGSSPSYRIQQAGYPGGYGGEATAWGMEKAIEPVQYWLASPEHRQILLNPAVTQVGIGYRENFAAPNIWYWTAEFASMSLPVVVALPPASTTANNAQVPDPTIQLLGPPQESEITLTADNNLIFTWSWPLPLDVDDRFVVYLRSNMWTYQIGVVRQPDAGSQYQFKVNAGTIPAAPGSYQWLIRLEKSGSDSVLEESEKWPIKFLSPSSG